MFGLRNKKNNFYTFLSRGLMTNINMIITKFNLVSAFCTYSKTCVKQPLSKRPKISFQDQLPLNAGQKNCRMLQGEHSEILSTIIRLSFVIKNFVLSIFEWPFYTGFTVLFCQNSFRIGRQCRKQCRSDQLTSDEARQSGSTL